MLIERGIVSPALEGSLRAMARVRNRLVHLYWAVDDARIHDYLQESVSDFDTFAEAVAGHEW